jgi:hypothetical protein
MGEAACLQATHKTANRFLAIVTSSVKRICHHTLLGFIPYIEEIGIASCGHVGPAFSSCTIQR